jgi:hypothetical protein
MLVVAFSFANRIKFKMYYASSSVMREMTLALLFVANLFWGTHLAIHNSQSVPKMTGINSLIIVD